jgi:hypothetical protein
MVELFHSWRRSSTGFLSVGIQYGWLSDYFPRYLRAPYKESGTRTTPGLFPITVEVPDERLIRLESHIAPLERKYLPRVIPMYLSRKRETCRKDRVSWLISRERALRTRVLPQAKNWQRGGGGRH